MTLGDGQEMEVLALIAERLSMGRNQYGPLDVNDGRDWEMEALEEALDGCAYLASAILKLRAARADQSAK